MERLATCKHEGCACQTRPREAPYRSGPAAPDPSVYCSGYCANVAQADEEGACACGHKTCQEAQLVRQEQDDVGISLGRGPGSPGDVGANES